VTNGRKDKPLPMSATSLGELIEKELADMKAEGTFEKNFRRDANAPKKPPAPTQ
jgi:hypothetical protein